MDFSVHVPSFGTTYLVSLFGLLKPDRFLIFMEELKGGPMGDKLIIIQAMIMSYVAPYPIQSAIISYFRFYMTRWLKR